jgi:hypothetical protein
MDRRLSKRPFIRANKFPTYALCRPVGTQIANCSAWPAGAKVERKVASPTAGRRKPNDGSPQDVENEVEDAGGQSGANHNK